MHEACALSYTPLYKQPPAPPARGSGRRAEGSDGGMDVEETKAAKAAHEAERKTVRRTMPTQMSRLRVFANSPAPHFESGFGRIAETRMKGLPILNPRIRVKADNFRRWGNDWIGTVTTPWAVIVVYACGCRESWVDVPAGEVRTLELPAGDFPFLGCRDDLLGDYRS